MKCMKRGFIFLLIMVLSVFTLGTRGCYEDSKVTITTNNSKHNFNIEVADTFATRAEGLMFREELPKNNGMFFIYNSEGNRSFWMKNTLIPLDMIFINSDLEIVSIQRNAQPCNDLFCKSYPSSKPAQYILEINGGLSKELGINIGDKVKLKL